MPGAAPTSVGWWWHARQAMRPEPVPARFAAGIAVVLDMAAVYLAVRWVLGAIGHPPQGLTHAVLPALFGGMLAFLGSLGGSVRSGLARAAVLGAISLPLTLLAVAVRDVPVAAGLSLAAASFGAGWLAWHGAPWASLGTLLLYLYFIPFAFGAGSSVAIGYLLVGFGVMIVVTLVMRGLVALVPDRHAPPRAQIETPEPAPAPRHGFTLLPGPELGRLQRTTIRSALALGVGAFAVSWTGHHNEVWVLMTLIALVPPAMPLTIDRVLARLVGTAGAMVVLTVIDALVPPGPMRLLVLVPGLVLAVAYLKRSYALSVLGVSVVAVLAYAPVTAPLGEALLWRGLDTGIGALIAIGVTLLIPVGRRPHPVWADQVSR
ncbi:MAG: FUSC family protein [Actinobacteria bacterium]|nr:FUSC family protein [Actinomycetota bacterium]